MAYFIVADYSKEDLGGFVYSDGAGNWIRDKENAHPYENTVLAQADIDSDAIEKSKFTDNSGVSILDDDDCV